MAQNQVDGVMIGPSGDLEYLVGFNPGGCERLQALVITRDKRHFYICNQLYLEDMQRVFSSDTRFYVWSDADGWQDTLHCALEDMGLAGACIAVSDSIRAVDLIDMKNFFSGIFVNGNGMLEEFRVIKREEDLENMRRAAHLADQVMAEMADYIRPGMTEKNIKEKILERFPQIGAHGISFTPIIASGLNSSRPHYCEDGRMITEKDVIVLDFGCKFNGLCSDISRTYFVGGISEEEEKIYRIVSQAHQAAVHTAKAGVACGDVDKAARDVIESAGYGDCFLNRTGHGIGFDVHEAPYIRGNSTQILERGMAFSIEPGIYIPGKFGMRIEDIVAINHDGATEILNRCSREITVIEVD